MKRSFVAGITAAAMLFLEPLQLSAYAVELTAEPDSTVKQGGVVNVTENGQQITIGNAELSRTFNTDGKKLHTVNLKNSRIDGEPVVFEPAKGSEEFVVRVTKKDASADPVHPSLDSSKWTAEADSYQNATGPDDGPPSNLLDNNINSIWHTKYNGSGHGPEEYPHHVVIDMKKPVTFECFSYTPRQVGDNGNILEYELYANDAKPASDEIEKGSDKTDAPAEPENTDKTDAPAEPENTDKTDAPAESENADKADASAEPENTNEESWRLISSGKFKYNGVSPIYVNLEKPVTASKVKLVAKSSANGERFAGGAEFDLHETRYETNEKNEREFYASDLTLAGEPEITPISETVNGKERQGKQLTFHFEPYKFSENDVTYAISENIVMYDGDPFMRKFLEIEVPDKAQWDKAAIDYIDLESFYIEEDEKDLWTVPKAGGIVEMTEFHANLGQPIYVTGMFFGCEFPAAHNHIEDGIGRLRYYSGKDFNRLQKDHQLDENGKYVTWNTVAGAGRSKDLSLLQSDFFEYIKGISVPSKFRLQYNSWFDNMMEIDDNNISESFIETERELSRVEVRPLDSYVVDDGWNNYHDTHVFDEKRSGTTINTSGFWDFNSKFPKQFTPASTLVQNFGSNFGTWVGPRGGYNYPDHLANILEKSGRGSGAAGSIDVADRTYLENFEAMAKNFQEDYQINYWKWDGFAHKNQYTAFPGIDGVPGYENRHMTGGFQHMYHVTDLWEGWVHLMDNVRAHASENDLQQPWISLTCYTNPSPWFLQWGNSVWIQCAADQADASFGQGKLDRQMTYRDANYYDFVKNHQFQFPLSNLYNHDPVYGKKGTNMDINTATDEEFKNYLYMMSTRGNAFWELHYSDIMMTPGKYEITGEFAEWAEKNYHILKNSKMIGGRPDITNLNNQKTDAASAEAYGFACFDGADGIISLRNPSATADKQIKFTFDWRLGVPKEATTMKYHLEHSHNKPAEEPTTGTLTYGKDYTFNLKPNEVLILRVSETGDTDAPVINRAYTDGKNTVTIRFNEKVTGSDIQVNNKSVKVLPSADGITYHLEMSDVPQNGETLTITANDIADLAGNALVNNTISTTYYQNNKAIETAIPVQNYETLLGKVDLSNDGFTINTFATPMSGKIVRLGEKAEVGITNEGNPYFKLDQTTVVSPEKLTDNSTHKITGVKENNGLIKIYVDGVLSASEYDASNRYFEVGNTDVLFNNGVAASVYSEALGYTAVKEIPQPTPPTDIATVTFKVENGTWSDHTTTEKKVQIPLVDGKGTLNVSYIPGDMIPDAGYTVGRWDTAPVTSIGGITQDVTYTYVFIKKSSGGGSGSSSSRPDKKPDQKPEEKPEEKPVQPEAPKVEMIPTVPGNPESIKAYTDVNGHWAKDSVSWAVTNQLFKGTSATQFAPDSAMTRGMLVTVLHRLAGQPQLGQSTFRDVPANAYYNNAVAWASTKGLVSGVGEGLFAPNSNITREQLAVILYKFAGSPAVSASNLTFSDAAAVSAWAKDAVSWSVNEALLSGMTDGTLAPGGQATRAQVATILMRFEQKH